MISLRSTKRNKPAGTPIRYRPWLFFSIDFAVTWIPLWTLVVGMRRGWLEFSIPFMIVAGTSATVVAAVFVHATRNRDFIRDFWRRAFDPRRIALPWWTFIILFQLVINVGAILMSTMWGGSFEQFRLSGYVAEAPLVFLLMTLLYGPLPEELGWRGYGLDALRTRMNLLEASLALALFWGLWHLPLHFMPGSFQQGLLEYPPALIAYVVAFVPGSIIMSWVYYRTGRSTLTAILIHYFGNVSGELFQMDLETRVIQTVLGLLLAGFILWKEWPMFTRREFYLSSGGAKLVENPSEQMPAE